MYMTSITRLPLALSCSALLYTTVFCRCLPSYSHRITEFRYTQRTQQARSSRTCDLQFIVSPLRATPFNSLRLPPSHHRHPPLTATNDAHLPTNNPLPNLPPLPSLSPPPLPSPHPPISPTNHPLPPLPPQRLH